MTACLRNVSQLPATGINSAFLSQTILSESYFVDIMGEEESIDVIKPVRLNLRACGEREVSVAQMPALS